MTGELLIALVRRAELRLRWNGALEALALGATAGLATLAAGVFEGRSIEHTGLALAAALAATTVAAASWIGTPRGARVALRELESARAASSSSSAQPPGQLALSRGELTTAWELALAAQRAPLARLAVQDCETRCAASALGASLPRPSAAWLALPIAAAALLALTLERAAGLGDSAGGGLVRTAVVRGLGPGAGTPEVPGSEAAQAWILALAEALDDARSGAAGAQVSPQAARERARLEAELERALAAWTESGGDDSGQLEALRAQLAAARAQTEVGAENPGAGGGGLNDSQLGLAERAPEGTMSGSTGLDESVQPDPSGSRAALGSGPPHAEAGLVRGRSWPIEYDAIVARWLSRAR